MLLRFCRKSRDKVVYFLSFDSEDGWERAKKHRKVEITDKGLDYAEGDVFMFFHIRSREIYLDGFGCLRAAVQLCEQRPEANPIAKAVVRINKEACSPIQFQQVNPKRPGSASYGRYEQYKSARSYDEMLELGGTRADFKYDLESGFIGSASLTPATTMGSKTSREAGKVELNFSELRSSQLTQQHLWDCAKRDKAGGLHIAHCSTLTAERCRNLCTELVGNLERSGFPVTEELLGWARYMFKNAAVVSIEMPSPMPSLSPGPRPEEQHLTCEDIEGHPGATETAQPLLARPWKHAHINRSHAQSRNWRFIHKFARCMPLLTCKLFFGTHLPACTSVAYAPPCPCMVLCGVCSRNVQAD
jgi:hypothetical protein